MVSSIRCGAVASACTASDFVQGTSPATAWSDHVGSRTCTFVLPSVLPHTLGGDWENTLKQFNAQSKWCAFFFCCVTQLCLHPAGVDKSACLEVNWMETLDAVSNIVPRVFTCVRRGTLSLGSCQWFPLSSLICPFSSLPSPLSLARVLRKVTRWRQLRATHSPISCTRESPEPG